MSWFELSLLVVEWIVNVELVLEDEMLLQYF
jgi:hypothetical protein